MHNDLLLTQASAALHGSIGRLPGHDRATDKTRRQWERRWKQDVSSPATSVKPVTDEKSVDQGR